MFDYDPRITSSSKEDIINNIMDSFSTMYLTMISIVQGVALSLLVFKVSTIIDWADFFAITRGLDSILPILSKGPYILTTFLLIILTWHSYFWLAAIARWVPVIWDSILFFVHGAFEFMLIGSLSHLDSFAWFYLFAFIGVISAIQYKYNSDRLDDKKKRSENNNVLDINIWQEDVEKLGKHVTKYKKGRVKPLWIVSSVVFIVAIVLDWVEPNSWLSLSFVSVSFIKYLKYVLIVVILGMHLYLIFAHVKAQKESLEKLTWSDSVVTS